MTSSVLKTSYMNHPQHGLIELISQWITPLGYRVIHIEIQSHRQRLLRIFIDRLEDSSEAIGIEDCVRVTRALEGPLEENPEIESLLPGTYELEVSSPGIDRPL